MKHKITILLVDDIRENLYTLRTLLEEKFDFLTIFEALSAQQALTILIKNPIDIILSDIQMPNMNGFEFVKFLKKNQKTRDIPVIFITATQNTEELMAIGYEAGALDYLVKPISDVMLHSKLKNYFEIFTLKRELQETNSNLDKLLTKNEKELKLKNAIFNSQEAIVLRTDGKQAIEINSKFFQLFGFRDIEDFRKKHHCICELFVDKQDAPHLMPNMDGINWLSYINLHKEIEHEAYMIDKFGHEHVYVVKTSGRIFEEEEEEVIVLTDVTKFKQQANLLVSQSKQAAMGEMLSMIAHQWRQPLTTVSAILGKMSIKQQMGMLNPADLFESLESAKVVIQHLSKTIDQFQDYFKEKDGELILVSTLMDNLALILDPIFEKFTISHEKSLTQNEVLVDDRIDQVLLNIYQNAVDELKKIDKDQERVISTTIEVTSDEKVLIRICDNAGPIPKDIIDKIFQPYFSTKAKNGSGLGLYMSKEIVEKQLKGKLSAYNLQNNDSACFEIELPLKKEI